jgi:hypothetical protein
LHLSYYARNFCIAPYVDQQSAARKTLLKPPHRRKPVSSALVIWLCIPVGQIPAFAGMTLWDLIGDSLDRLSLAPWFD